MHSFSSQTILDENLLKVKDNTTYIAQRMDENIVNSIVNEDNLKEIRKDGK